MSHPRLAANAVPSMSLTTQKQLRQASDPGFCYHCGGSWTPEDCTNRDHIPPKHLFAEADRTPPLIMRTHVSCNSMHSPYDEQIGQAVSILWKQSPTSKDVSSLHLSLQKPVGMAPFVVVQGLEFKATVARWLKAFHAALYRQALLHVSGTIFEPFPEVNRLGEGTNVHISHPHIVSVIKRNRAVDRLDRIVAYNEKCLYECVWSHLDDGRPMCIWALDLYGWHELGDTNNCLARSCVGWYLPTNGIPDGATQAVEIEVPHLNRQPLNAFE